MKTSHTPGPWEIETNDLDSFTVYSAKMNIAEVLAIGGEGMSDEGQANARLIAAAPELLAALEDVLHYCVTPKGMPDKDKGRTAEQQQALDNARNAIAKATQP